MENKIQKVLLDWEDIKVQFNEKQQKDMEHIIWMAKETDEPQKAILGSGLELAVWPSGKISKLALEKECSACQGKGTILKSKEAE